MKKSSIQDQAQLFSSNRLEMTRKNIHKDPMASIEIDVFSSMQSQLNHAFSKPLFYFGNKYKE